MYMHDDEEYNEFRHERAESVGHRTDVGCGNGASQADASGDAFGGEPGKGRQHKFFKNRKKIIKDSYVITKKGIACILVFCLILSAAFGVGGAALIGGIGDTDATSVADASDASNSSDDSGAKNITLGTGTNLQKATGSELTIAEIAAMTANSVVEIRTEAVATDTWMMQYVTEGAGSGVIVSTDGYILTNNHVIEDAKTIKVTLKDGTEYDATLVATDSQTDVAVIKIDASGLTSAVYGDSDKLVVGDLAVAIGNPLGQLGGTVTAGIISALDRELTIDGKSMTLLQTDASINPGNSGGGLFNEKGELVGLVVAKSSGSDVEGLGFAIPINTVKEVANQLVNYGYVKGRVAMGITFVDLTSTQYALSYGVRTLGIYVKSVDGENAKKSGIQAGDMIYYIDDTQITSASDLTSTIQKYSVGDKIRVTVVRNGEIKELSLTLSEKTNQ